MTVSPHVKQTKLKFGQPWTAELILDSAAPAPYFATELGVLFENDCMDVLPHVRDESVDTMFADPPFNLGKSYGDRFDDNLPDTEYVAWCKRWLDECIRIVKPGGSLFLYNLPKWNILLGAHLMQRRMTFRHDIAVSIKLSLPIPGRLYPAHYSLLYFTKGKPKTFRRIRTPIEVCRHCGGEIKDYGGHRDAMNPKGVNLMDVWTDIPPVRHWKFKSKKRTQNQLSTKLVRRAIVMSTRPGEVVLDPFGGAGTTFDVCEHLHCHWIGAEIQNCDVIVERLESMELAHHSSDDYLDD
jgi:site-specific DNA-methyltransferase (adenine-specific)